MEIASGQTWEHYKGGVYTVVCLALMEENGTPVVVYRSAETRGNIVRPVANWNEMVGGKPRFSRVADVT